MLKKMVPMLVMLISRRQMSMAAYLPIFGFITSAGCFSTRINPSITAVMRTLVASSVLLCPRPFLRPLDLCPPDLTTSGLVCQPPDFAGVSVALISSLSCACWSGTGTWPGIALQHPRMRDMMIMILYPSTSLILSKCSCLLQIVAYPLTAQPC